MLDCIPSGLVSSNTIQYYLTVTMLPLKQQRPFPLEFVDETSVQAQSLTITYYNENHSISLLVAILHVNV